MSRAPPKRQDTQAFPLIPCHDNVIRSGSVTKMVLSSTALKAHGCVWHGIVATGAPRLHLVEESATALLLVSCTHRCSGLPVSNRQKPGAGAGCARIFTAEASGAQRQLHAALDYLRPDDTLVVWNLDRLACSLCPRLDIVEALHRRQMGLRSLTAAIDTGTPGGTLVLSPPSVYTALVSLPMRSCEEDEDMAAITEHARGAALPRGTHCHAGRLDRPG